MPSKSYERALAESTRHHASSKTYSGKFLRPHKPFLVELIGRLGITSALDYGCGKGEQYRWVDPEDDKLLEEAFGFEVAKFDPAWPPYAAEPQGQFDLVICTHTLGSIPVEDLRWVIERLYGHATKAVFVAVKIGELKKKVFSRPEAHPIGWTQDQWLERIAPMALKHLDRLETHVSFRTRDELGSHLERWRRIPDGWCKDFQS